MRSRREKRAADESVTLSMGKGQDSTDDASGGMRAAVSALAIPNFRTHWFGTLFSIGAFQMDLVARSWLAYSISGSGLVLGLVAMAYGLALLIFSLVGGLVADRLEKRKVLVIAQIALSVVALMNAVVVHFGLVQAWHLAVFGGLQGAALSFNFPARMAYIPELVGQKKLASAIAVDAAGRNTNRVLAPALAGLILGWSPTIAFYVIAALYGASALTLVRLPLSRAQSSIDERLFASVAAGFSYVWRQPAIRALLALAIIPLVLGTPYQQLLPVFQSDVLHVSPGHLGFMYAAAGIGAVVGTIAIARLSRHPRLELLQVVACASLGVSLLLFALSNVYEISLLLLFLAGGASQTFFALNNLLLMAKTDAKLYGRVMGIYSASWGLPAIATTPLGASVDVVGVVPTVAGAAFLLIVFLVAILARYPEHWRSPARLQGS